MVQGDRNVNGDGDDGCPNELLVPSEIQRAIESAWGEAQVLLKGGVRRNLILVPTDETGNVAPTIDASGNEVPQPIALLANYNGIGLISIEATVEGESVAVFKGCVGTEKPTETQIANKQAAQEAKISDTITRKCWESSTTTSTLKAINLIDALNAECPPGGISAGFALRTNSRSVSLKAKWLIKKEILETKLDYPFDYSSIDFYANANADASGFAAAVLPLPPGGKKIAGALLDKLGTLSFGAMKADSRVLIPDEFNRKVTISGQKMKKASNLAIAIATRILSPLCVRAAELEIEADRVNCELDKDKFIRQTETAATIDKNYKKVAINSCDGGLMKATVYAKFRKPQIIPNEKDVATGEPVKERYFLSSPGKTKMAVWRATGNVSSALKYLVDATWLGKAQNPSKCGNIDANTEYCESFELKSLPGSGLDCGKINSKQASAYLSFLRDSGSMNALD